MRRSIMFLPTFAFICTVAFIATFSLSAADEREINDSGVTLIEFPVGSEPHGEPFPSSSNTEDTSEAVASDGPEEDRPSASLVTTGGDGAPDSRPTVRYLSAPLNGGRSSILIPLPSDLDEKTGIVFVEDLRDGDLSQRTFRTHIFRPSRSSSEALRQQTRPVRGARHSNTLNDINRVNKLLDLAPPPAPASRPTPQPRLHSIGLRIVKPPTVKPTPTSTTFTPPPTTESAATVTFDDDANNLSTVLTSTSAPFKPLRSTPLANLSFRSQTLRDIRPFTTTRRLVPPPTTSRTSTTAKPTTLTTRQQTTTSRPTTRQTSRPTSRQTTRPTTRQTTRLTTLITETETDPTFETTTSEPVTAPRRTFSPRITTSSRPKSTAAPRRVRAPSVTTIPPRSGPSRSNGRAARTTEPTTSPTTRRPREPKVTSTTRRPRGPTVSRSNGTSSRRVPGNPQIPGNFGFLSSGRAFNLPQNVPGRAGTDYPVYHKVPFTNFECKTVEFPGFYADMEAGCQVYHSCHGGRGRQHSFLCPNGTIFSQEFLICDWYYNVNCELSPNYFFLNKEAFSAQNKKKEVVEEKKEEILILAL